MFEKIEEIHLSLVNGQRQQAVEQIKDYGARDFFAYYSRMLYDDYNSFSAFNYLSDAINQYFRITDDTI